MTAANGSRTRKMNSSGSNNAVPTSFEKGWREPRRSCPILGGFLLVLIVLTVSSRAGAQATVEYGSSTASMGSAAAKTKPGPVFSPPAVQGDKSTHLPLPKDPTPDLTNRRALEGRAGKDAGKLLLRSVPSEAGVWIDGLFVGKTPLMLVLAPGNYRLEMRGARMEFGEQRIPLRPRENRVLVMTLTPRYPARVHLP